MQFTKCFTVCAYGFLTYFEYTLCMRLAVTLGLFGIPASVATYMLYTLLDVTPRRMLTNEGIGLVLDYLEACCGYFI